MNLLPVLRKLLSSSTYCYEFNDESDYQFPGSLPFEYPKRPGYCADITTLANFTSADEHFHFSDIHLGKGKPRNAHKVMFEVDKVQEELWYRIAPCAGIKSCSVPESTFTASTREHVCPSETLIQVTASCWTRLTRGVPLRLD